MIGVKLLIVIQISAAIKEEISYNCTNVFVGSFLLWQFFTRSIKMFLQTTLLTDFFKWQIITMVRGSVLTTVVACLVKLCSYFFRIGVREFSPNWNEIALAFWIWTLLLFFLIENLLANFNKNSCWGLAVSRIRFLWILLSANIFATNTIVCVFLLDWKSAVFRLFVTETMLVTDKFNWFATCLFCCQEVIFSGLIKAVATKLQI